MSEPDRPITGVPAPAGGPPAGLRSAWCGELRAGDVGQVVQLCGWVARRRQHGEHLAFVDLRDRTGVVQCVVDGARDLRAEWVLRLTGTVRSRPAGTVNPGLPTGEVEVGDCEVEVLAEAEPPPVPLTDRVEVDEGVRLRYRYVDLRRARLQANLALRSRVTGAIRRAMERQGFIDVETPLLWTPTPEGAREFAVPSRLHRGNFYVLPQSPQIAKQLLMVAGVDRYYQIARCLRDEDLRADRQFEFTQLDVEASFVTQDEVHAFVAEAVLDATEAATGERPPPIPRLTWAEALDRYGTDKPDLRFGMELVELTDAVASSGFRAFQAPSVKALRVPGGADLPRSRLDGLVDRAKALGARGLVWLRAVPAEAGVDLEGPGAVTRHLEEKERAAIAWATGAAAGDLVLVVADEHHLACRVLGQLRVELGQPPVWEGPYRYAWVVDFPLFEGLDDEGRPV
ncbi:MAG TPA: aspartate--tRNA ligase, partial [Acidimicrobiales bacterium]|nr:aspartate--tRNA ligase [Acidimicrobiales bacterium]